MIHKYKNIKFCTFMEDLYYIRYVINKFEKYIIDEDMTKKFISNQSTNYYKIKYKI